jgi:hypothetical protein
MTHLAPRLLAARSALRAERESRTLAAQLFPLCAIYFASRKSTQIFLENADAVSHYHVMGAGDAVRPAMDRLPAVDRKSRSTLDIRVVLSICEITQDKRADRNSTKARRKNATRTEENSLSTSNPLNIR